MKKIIYISVSYTHLTVSLREVNSIQTTSTERYKKLMSEGSMPATMESFEVKAYTPDLSLIHI